jgi:uncharacterized membrane protein YqjE
MGSAWGRRLTLLAILVAIALVVVALIYRKGRKDEKLDRTLQRLETLRERIKVDEDIRRMSPADRRDALRRWVR